MDQDRLTVIACNEWHYSFSNSNEVQPETLLIDELKEGESYELLITNIDGLYRFRLGDVIKVVGFYNKSPIIEVRFRYVSVNKALKM